MLKKSGKSATLKVFAAGAGLAALCLATSCSDTSSHNGRLGEDWLRPVPADGLVAFKQVFISARVDTIRNCDTASEYKVLVKANPPGDDGKGDFHYDAFASNGFKMPLFTFQKFSGDSLFLIATVNKGGADNFYTGVCIEKKDVARTFMLVENAAARPEPKKMHGGPPHRRASGGGMGHG